jgi:hypothetical protein
VFARAKLAELDTEFIDRPLCDDHSKMVKHSQTYGRVIDVECGCASQTMEGSMV